MSPLNPAGFGALATLEGKMMGETCKQSKESLIKVGILASYSADVADSGWLESLDIRAATIQG